MNTKYMQKELGFTIRTPYSILRHIHSLGLQFHPHEFGGVFLGICSKYGKEITITEMVVPTKYVSKQHIFTRHPNGLNQRIAEAYEESGGKVNYVGEWHTHTSGNSMFSSKDLKTMRKISAAAGVKTRSPLLLVAGITTSKFNPTFYIFHQQKLYAYEQT